MNRLLTPGAVLAVSLIIAACGGAGAGGESPGSATPVAGATTVTVRSIDAVGDVLVDASGNALYVSDVEADGRVRCNGPCTTFWEPLTLAAGTPTASEVSGAAGRLDVIKRPDGARQVTIDDKPAYTFSEDTPGAVTGDGFSDDFDGRHFVWSVVAAGDVAATPDHAPAAPPANDYGY